MSKVVEVFFQFLINLSYAFSFYFFFPLFYFASSPSLSPLPPPSLSYLISLTDKRLHISYLCYIYISFLSPPPALLSQSVCLCIFLSFFSLCFAVSSYRSSRLPKSNIGDVIRFQNAYTTTTYQSHTKNTYLPFLYLA